MNIFELRADDIAALCRKHKVVELSAFGSVVRNELRSDSDIDLLVTFENVSLDDYADNYFSLCEALEEILERKVDLVVDKAVKNPFFREELEETKQLLFAA